MKLPLFRAALKDSRFSTIIYCVVLVLYGLMLLSAFSSVEDTFSDPFAEFNGLTVTETDEKVDDLRIYNLSWETQAGVLSHVAFSLNTEDISDDQMDDLIEGTIPDEVDDLGMDWERLMELLDSMPGLEEQLSDQGIIEPKAPPFVDENGSAFLYMGEGSFVNFLNTADSDIFFVLLVPNDGNLSNSTIKGPAMLGNLATISDFDKYLEDNAFVEGFLGDIEIDFSTLEGYLALEYFSLWPLLFIIFLAVKTAGSVSKHVEDRSMDILLATGYSRMRFLNEKVLLILVNLFLVVSAAFLGLVLGTFMVGETIPLLSFVLAFLDSLPMAIAILGVSLLISVLVDEGGKAIGIVMGIVLGEYMLNVVANIASWGDWLSYFSIYTYSDFNGAMLDHTLDPVNVIVPLVVGGIAFGLAYFLFKRKEIHA